MSSIARLTKSDLAGSGLMKPLDAMGFSADAIDVNDSDRKQAFQLYHQHSMPEAADLLEKVVVKLPADVAVQEALGVALVSRAETQTDAEKARADRLGARRALLRAKELGDTSDLSSRRSRKRANSPRSPQSPKWMLS